MAERARPYMNPYVAGTILGIVLFLAFFITGTGLGASGGLNRALVYAQNIISPEHIDQVPYLLKMAGGSTNPLNNWIVYLTAGTLLGGYLGGQVGRRMDESDRRQAGLALDSTPTHQSSSWQNPDTGSRYAVTPTRTFYTDDQPCREYTTEAWIDGYRETVYGTACRQTDGTWLASN